MTAEIDQMDQCPLILVHQADFYERVSIGSQLPRRNESIYDIAEKTGVRGKTMPIVERTEFPRDPGDCPLTYTLGDDGRNRCVLHIDMYLLRRSDHRWRHES